LLSPLFVLGGRIQPDFHDFLINSLKTLLHEVRDVISPAGLFNCIVSTLICSLAMAILSIPGTPDFWRPRGGVKRLF
jgi:hypothetical protein